MSSGGQFQRSPSKVWWASEGDVAGNDSPSTSTNTSSTLSSSSTSSAWTSRTTSGSPSSHKSQDSGFSDSETSPPTAPPAARVARNEAPDEPIDHGVQAATPKREFTPRRVPVSILKEMSTTETKTPEKNLSENIKEKFSSPKKSISSQLNEEVLNKSNQRTPNCDQEYAYVMHISNATSPLTSVAVRTPIKSQQRLTQQPSKNTNPNSSIGRKIRAAKGSPKVNRNLMTCFPNVVQQANGEDAEYPSYNELENMANQCQEPERPGESKDSDSSARLEGYTSYYASHLNRDSTKANRTAPAGLFYCRSRDSEDNIHEAVTSFSRSDSLSSRESHDSALNQECDSQISQEDNSDCDRELQSFFPECADLPAHTSTPNRPNGATGSCTKSRIKAKIAARQIAEKESYTAEQLKELFTSTSDSVKCWLKETEILYEPECMTALQNKSIAADLARKVSLRAEKMMAPIRQVLSHIKAINQDHGKIKRKISKETTSQLVLYIQSLASNITEFMLSYVLNSKTSTMRETAQREQNVHDVLDLCSRLRQSSESTNVTCDKIEGLLDDLMRSYKYIEDIVLNVHIQILITSIEEPQSQMALRASLTGLTTLALQRSDLCQRILQAGCIRALLILCLECQASTIRTMALRALATVCCNTTAIRQLEKIGGVEIISEIMAERCRPEPELSEATAVLAQITAPWIEDNDNINGLSDHLAKIVYSLTDFIERTSCCQNLLLCAAALANLSSMTLAAIELMINNYTVAKLLNAIQNRGPQVSVFLKEQTATLLANMSAIPEFRIFLAEQSAIVALLCFLQIYPSNCQTEAQQNAAERLQQKSAIALSRLCSDKSIAEQVVELEGVERLIQLCKEKRERNNSDAVLVACLATLRKITANCGTNVMKEQDAMELVEPRLLDSFLAYSTQNESYV